MLDSVCKVSSQSIIAVLSPLNSLKNDQVVPALVSLGRVMQSEVTEGVVRGEYQTVMLTLEVMLTDLKCREMFRSKVCQDNLVGLVVDEVHCIEKWSAQLVH